MPVNLVNENFNTVTANSVISMKWLRFLVKVLLPLRIVLGSIVSFGNYYNQTNELYNGDFIAFLSFTPNLIAVITWIASVVLEYRVMIGLTCFSLRAVKLWKFDLAIIFFGQILQVVFCIPYGAAQQVAIAATPYLVSYAVLYITNSVYFKKRASFFS